MSGNVTLREKISSIEAQMGQKLSEARATFKQSGDVGDRVEDVFREFLHQFLPNSLRVGHGEIIDVHNQRSRQTDVVLADEEHPFTFTQDKPGLFFIEGVAAAGEIKSVLTGPELESALDNSCQFKRLESSPGVNPFSQANLSDLDRFSQHPAWFLFAYESELKLPTIAARIEEFVEQRNIQNNLIADAVFVLDRGWVINFGKGDGAIQYFDEKGQSLGGWQSNDSESVLFDFLAWLHSVMPKVIRFEPVLVKYLLPPREKLAGNST